MPVKVAAAYIEALCAAPAEFAPTNMSANTPVPFYDGGKLVRERDVHLTGAPAEHLGISWCLVHGPGNGRSSCRPLVPRQDRGAGLLGRDELQVGGRASGEQPLTGAEDGREGQQPVLVDQVVAP
jgi:hypothetical protein